MNVRLKDVISGVEPRRIVGGADIRVTDIVLDSRKATPGSLFACIRGSRVDGAAFSEDAAKRGASAILTEKEISLPAPVTQIIVSNVRRALALVSSNFFGRPSEHLTVVGVTGTNGKTTTVQYIRSIVEAAGYQVGVMGTLGHWLGGAYEKDAFTTPEAPEVQRYMRRMVDGGAEYCVMEVSSHAIALRRVDEVAFKVVAFTNLTRDHLDFHADFDEYAATKMQLFGIAEENHAFGTGRLGAVNIADPSGRQIKRLSPLPCTTYAVGQDADVRGEITSLRWQGTEMKVIHKGRPRLVATPLRGRINAENALAAYTVSLLLGIDEEAIARGLSSLAGVPGRMEYIESHGRQAIVDYAHTPDALERLLGGVREMRTGRIICVFGCGGDRDRGKRPEMARIAAGLADLVIVTSDNPRTEDPLAIIGDILRGMPEGAAYEVVPDRGEAIRHAAAVSAEGDVIVVAGKGHEDYQIIGETRTRFDDREAIRRAFGVSADART